MRVLYLTGMYPTPAFPQKGIFCHEQVKALKKQGVDVDVVVPVTFYDREKPPKVWEYEGVTVRYVRFFKVPGVRLFEKIGTFFYWALRFSGIDFRKYDVLHADAPLPAGYAAMKISQKFKIPYVIHGHGLDVFSEKSYAGAPNCHKIVEISARVYEKADAIAGVSQKVLDQIQTKVDVAQKAYVVFNGVDGEQFCPVEKPDTQKVTFISIGNLIPLKGHDYTLRAIKALVDKGHTNICLKLLGRGYLEQELKDLAKELEIESYVDLIGYVPYDDVRKQLQESDVFVLPSWYEALGCVYLEAMACGLPAIGCFGNGIDEVILQGKTGYLVENKSLDQLIACMEGLLDKTTRQQIGKAAREAVVEGYLWKHSAEALVQTYESCREGGHRNGL